MAPGATRTWVHNNNNASNYVSLGISSTGYSNITVASYYTTNTTLTNTLPYNILGMWGSSTYMTLEKSGSAPIFTLLAKTALG